MPLELEIRGAIILSAHNGYVPFIGSVGIEDGQIAVVSERPLGLTGGKVVDAAGKIMVPGLVNGHCHGDMTFARGLGDGMTLREQNEAFEDTCWFYDIIDDDTRYLSRQLTYCEALISGTTFILENMYWGLGVRSAEAMAATGIRGALAEDMRKDFSNPDDLLSDSELAEIGGACRKAGLIPVIGGVSEEDYEPGLVKHIDSAARRNGFMQTMHLAETPWRLKIVKEKYGTTPIRFLREQDILNKETIASHVVHLDSEEISILKAADAKVVNTPLCEMKIADGIAPIPEMLRAGVTVGLGTDGAMWNNSNDIFREMKAMMLLHSVNSGIRSLKTTDALDMATINGAKVFGLENQLGTIEQGKLADFALVDATAPHMRPLRMGKHENIASAVVFCATGRDVTDVFVGGRQLVNNGSMTGFDLEKLLRQVDEASNCFAEKLGQIKKFKS